MKKLIINNQDEFNHNDFKNYIIRDRIKNPIFFTKSTPALQDIVVEVASELKLEIFRYGDKNYIELTEVKFEAELHFDGVTSPRNDRVPDFVIFEFIKNPDPTSIDDYFYLVDGVRLAELVDTRTKYFLSKNKLAIKGMKNKIIEDWAPEFEIQLLRNDFGEERIIGHIPTCNLSKLNIIDGWVHSSNEDFCFKFNDSSAEKTISIFYELHDLINSNQNVISSFIPQDGLSVIIDNKRIMHGRTYTGKPYERLMRRTQLKIY